MLSDKNNCVINDSGPTECIASDSYIILGYCLVFGKINNIYHIDFKFNNFIIVSK